MRLEAYAHISQFIYTDESMDKPEKSFAMLQALLYHTKLAIMSGHLSEIRLRVCITSSHLLISVIVSVWLCGPSAHPADFPVFTFLMCTYYSKWNNPSTCISIVKRCFVYLTCMQLCLDADSDEYRLLTEDDRSLAAYYLAYYTAFSCLPSSLFYGTVWYALHHSLLDQ